MARAPKTGMRTAAKPRVARSVVRRNRSRSPAPWASAIDGNSTSVSAPAMIESGVTSCSAGAYSPASSVDSPPAISWESCSMPALAMLPSAANVTNLSISARRSAAGFPRAVHGQHSSA